MQTSECRKASVSRGLSFLGLWLKRPRSMGAIAPSSDGLAAAIAREIDFESPGAIIELGGGTGSITTALVENALHPQDIVVIEREASLCTLLARRFPAVRVICGDARDLPRLLDDGQIGPVNAIVSGLPLLAMPRRTRFEILRHAFAVLPADGVFLQFTYGLAPPVPRTFADRTRIVGRRSAWVLRNLPPAFLWHYRHGTDLADAEA